MAQSPFTWLQTGNSQGYTSAAPYVGTGNTHTTTTLDTLSPALTAPKGSLVLAASSIPKPDFLSAIATAATSVTLLTAASSSVTTLAVNVLKNPILIGGEATALTNGSAVTSNYWQITGGAVGVFNLASDEIYALISSMWFMAGGAFTPSAGGALSGWFLPSIDGGTNFETALATPSATVPALPRSPDVVFSLDAAAHAAGTIRFAQGRIITPPPEADCKFILQNNSGVTMPSTWCIGMGPAAVGY